VFFVLFIVLHFRLFAERRINYILFLLLILLLTYIKSFIALLELATFYFTVKILTQVIAADWFNSI